MNKLQLQKMLESFLLEDIGSGDLTSNAIFPEASKGRGVFLAKEEGIVSGLEVIREAYHLLEPDMRVETRYKDGDPVNRGDVIAEVYGPIRSILSGERLVLNLLQRMSGIATMTRKCVEALDDPSHLRYEKNRSWPEDAGQIRRQVRRGEEPPQRPV